MTRLPSIDRIAAAIAVVLLVAVSVAQATETLTFIHTDIAGSPVAATDAAGNLLWREGYRPYGERTKNQLAAATNRNFFHGKTFDADTDLTYFGARYYDSVVGRFMGVDPQGFEEQNLHSFNRYIYGNNNPYKYRDPDGQNALYLLAFAAVATGVYVIATGSYRQLGLVGAGRRGHLDLGPSIIQNEGSDKGDSPPQNNRVDLSGGAATPPPPEGPETKESTKGNSVRNTDARISRSDLEKNLEERGYTRSLSKDGEATNYVKGNERYSVRDKSNEGSPTADVYRNNRLVEKIRLKGD